jgi:hypothetical protein
MKRMYLLVAAAVVCLGLSGATLAQTNSWFGTWKLNVEKSKFVGAPAPKSLTRTVEAAGDGGKYFFEGVATDGSALNYSFTVKYDGNDNVISGSGMPFGADTIALKRVSSKISTGTLKKAGTVVAHVKTVVAADGKSLTVSYHDAAGKPGSVTSWDKQ